MDEPFFLKLKADISTGTYTLVKVALRLKTASPLISKMNIAFYKLSCSIKVSTVETVLPYK